MEPSECAEVIKRHPELILVSNNPVTWEGMLTVATNSMEKIKFRLKLTLPNFPDYHDASIKFGKNSAGLFRGNFNNKLDDLLGNITSIKSFLKHLQKLIVRMMFITASQFTRSHGTYTFFFLRTVFLSQYPGNNLGGKSLSRYENRRLLRHF